MAQEKTWLTAIVTRLSGLFRSRTPAGMTVIEPFDITRYLGIWYEIARLDHRFERGLQRVTASYSLREDGTVQVVNSGFDPNKAEWRESTGKAVFRASPQRAALKVSFFGPFYGGYNVIALDDAYQNALVCGPNLDYLWLLSRAPIMDRTTREEFLALAQGYGFATEQLIWVRHMP